MKIVWPCEEGREELGEEDTKERMRGEVRTI